MRWFSAIIIVLVLASAAVLGWSLLHYGGATPSEQQMPAPPLGNDVRFLVVGDNHGVNAIYEEALARADELDVDFVLNVADLTEHGSAEEFDAVASLERRFATPVLHTVGSHDIVTDPTRALFEERFEPRWYSRDVGPLHLVVLDNGDRRVGFEAEQLAWLERDLAGAAGKTIVIAYHRPFGYPLADVIGDDETPASRRTNDAFRALLRRSAITRIFNAHLHTHVTFQLDGIPVEITGGGGDPAQEILGGPEQSFFHAILVSVNDDGLRSQVIPLGPSD